MKTLTLLFVIFLLLVILAADLGLGPYLFAFLAPIPGGDMLGHFVLMGVLSFLVNTLLRGRVMRLRSLRLPLGTALILPLVTLEEFSQLFLQHRGFSLVDLAADYAGILLFGYLAVMLQRRSKLSQNA